MSSRLIPTILAVHARIAGLPGLATAGAAVVLGPVVSQAVRDTVWVGFDGDPEGDFRAGTRESTWAGLGARRRDETVEVDCAITSLVGGGTVEQALARIAVLFDLVEDGLRADPSLGQTPTPYVAAVEDGRLDLLPTTDGLEPRLGFKAVAQTRT